MRQFQRILALVITWLPGSAAILRATDGCPEFDKPLGAPKGGAKRDGWTCRRECAHASVFVDVEKKTPRIHWK